MYSLLNVKIISLYLLLILNIRCFLLNFEKQIYNCLQNADALNNCTVGDIANYLPYYGVLLENQEHTFNLD